MNNNNKNGQRWYQHKCWNYRSNSPVLPSRIYLMWRHTNWAKWLKITLSAFYGLVTLIWSLLALNPQPYISVDSLKNGRISTDSANYTVTGSLSGLTDGVKVMVNNKEAKRDGNKFSVSHQLKDGNQPCCGRIFD